MIQANQSAAVLQEELGIGPITNENHEYGNAVLFGTLKMANALVDSIISPSRRNFFVLFMMPYANASESLNIMAHDRTLHKSSKFSYTIDTIWIPHRSSTAISKSRV